MQRISYDVLRKIDSASFSGSYQALGSPLTFAAAITKLVNASNTLVTVSVDGVHDHDILPSGSYSVYDETANHNYDYSSLAKGTQYYVKGSAGLGFVYLVCQYILPS
jgi:hypothetical protein